MIRMLGPILFDFFDFFFRFTVERSCVDKIVRREDVHPFFKCLGQIIPQFFAIHCFRPSFWIVTNQDTANARMKKFSCSVEWEFFINDRRCGAQQTKLFKLVDTDDIWNGINGSLLEELHDIFQFQRSFALRILSENWMKIKAALCH